MDLTNCYWDRRTLRVQPHEDADIAGLWNDWSHRHLPPHRDTWGSNIQCQSNWWAPLYPLTADATLLLYPSFFAEKVPNSSADWDLDRVIKEQRGLKVQAWAGEAAGDAAVKAKNENSTHNNNSKHAIMPEIIDPDILPQLVASAVPVLIE